MKYLILLVLAVVFSTTNIKAQFDDNQYTVKLPSINYKENYKAGRDLYVALHKQLTNDFNIGWHSNIQVKAIINTGKAHLIEGMDVKAVGEPQIEFVIKDFTTKKEETFIFSKHLSAKTPAKLGAALVEEYLNDTKTQDDLNLFIKSFVDKLYANGCTKQLAKVDKLALDKKYDQALRLLTNLTPSPCKDQAKSKQIEILKLQGELACETKIQKATIMVNSGISFQLRRAIPILMSIPPDASCAEEALALSKTIGSKMENTKQISTDMNQYQGYHSSGNINQWRMYYLQQLMEKRSNNRGSSCH